MCCVRFTFHCLLIHNLIDVVGINELKLINLQIVSAIKDYLTFFGIIY